jgi:hypothetical protein
MQKVVGSSPIIRSLQPRSGGVFAAVSEPLEGGGYLRSMFRRVLSAAAVSLALVLAATAALPAEAKTKTALDHKLIVAVKKTMAPADEKKLAVLVLINQKGGPAAGALATPSKPLTVLQDNSGHYRVKAEIDSTCKGSCDAPSFRISGSAKHKLEVVPSCQLKGAVFVCSKVKVVKIY